MSLDARIAAAKARGYGPARVGDQAYAWRDGTLAERDPAHAAMWRGALSDEERERLRQRALLLALGEADRLIPWHPRDLDLRAWRTALGLLAKGRSLEGAELLADVHGDPRLDDAEAAVELGLCAAVAEAHATAERCDDDACRAAALLARLRERPTRPPPPAWSALIAAPAPPPGSGLRPWRRALLRRPGRGVLPHHDIEQAAQAELAAEATRRDGDPDHLLVAPPGVAFGTLVWSGARVRMALRDPLETFVPAWITTDRADRPFPGGRNEAMAAAAWRLSRRGPVVLVCGAGRARQEAAEGLLRAAGAAVHGPRRLGEARRAALAAIGVKLADGPELPSPRVLLTTPEAPLATWPDATAIVLTAPEAQGLPVERHWLHQAAGTLTPWPRPLVLVGVDGQRPRERVVREVQLAEALCTPPERWRSPLARLLAAALPTARPPGLADALAMGDLAPLGREAEWVDGIVAMARAARPALPRQSAAWRTADDPCVRALLAWAWRLEAPDGDPDP